MSVLYLTLAAASLVWPCGRGPDTAWSREAGHRVEPVPVTVLFQDPFNDPDLLYANREDLASARRAAAVLADRLASNPQDFDTAWKLARAYYWLGGHVPREPPDEFKQHYRRGMDAAQRAVDLQPGRPEGYFWLGANMGRVAESHGLMAGLKYRGRIREQFQKVLEIDPSFEQRAGDQALGRWYAKVPGLFGGDKKKAEMHLRRSLEANPDNPASLYFLAELLLDTGRPQEARATLHKVLDAPLAPESAPEDREFKEQARQLLAKLDR